MRSLVRQAVFVVVNVVAIAAATGCQVPPSTINPVKPQSVSPGPRLAFQQLIIKFKPNISACDATGIAQLSVRTQVPLEFVRIMSGDACVIRQLADHSSKFSQGQKILKQDSTVEWVESDSVMKTQ